MNQKIKPKKLTIFSGDYKLYGKLWVVNKEAPTILLLHGLGFHSFEYEELAPILSENGFNCLAFDFRCHGRSEGKRGYWTLQELVDDAKNAVDYAYNRFNDKIGIFGNSLGAIVAVFAAAQSQAY
ncbi:lysophospholipase [Patescibacteria group bacterium]|nr:lysophospholipase [Patescibacteria group bacterium]